MFGHNDDDDAKTTASPAEPTEDGTLDAPSSDTTDDSDSSPLLSAPSLDTTHNDTPESTTQEETPEPVLLPHKPEPVSASLPTPPSTTSDDLIGIKQSALQQLKPLVGHLEQTPEEKFRTTMMMIQAADDQSLIHDAYEAARAISDEKVRAQALLDVVNEINYFSSQNNQKDS